MKFWLTIYKLAWGALVILLVVLVFHLCLPSIRQTREKQRRIAALEEENREKEDAINAIKRNRKLFESSSDFVERIAREELGKVKEGETVFRFAPTP